jgi:hypothetical protein
MMNCPICKQDCNEAFFSGDKVTCPRCGNYQINDAAVIELKAGLKDSDRKVANASGWIREHQNIQVDSEVVSQLVSLATPSIGNKSLQILKHLEGITTFLGERFKRDKSYLAIASVISNDELDYLFQYLKANSFIEFNKDSYYGIHNIYITPEGFAYLDKEKYSNAESQLGFCAMWFDPKVKSIWHDAIHPAILAAGYEPKRIDEHQHNNRIDDEIIATIRRSKFVVADFTGQRGGVYFEAGFALGMNLPVIWTVEKSELEKVHFDNRQYNFVVWEEDKLPEFQQALQMRIESTLGRGKYQPT